MSRRGPSGWLASSLGVLGLPSVLLALRGLGSGETMVLDNVTPFSERSKLVGRLDRFVKPGETVVEAPAGAPLDDERGGRAYSVALGSSGLAVGSCWPEFGKTRLSRMSWSSARSGPDSSPSG